MRRLMNILGVVLALTLLWSCVPRASAQVVAIEPWNSGGQVTTWVSGVNVGSGGGNFCYVSPAYSNAGFEDLAITAYATGSGLTDVETCTYWPQVQIIGSSTLNPQSSCPYSAGSTGYQPASGDDQLTFVPRNGSPPISWTSASLPPFFQVYISGYANPTSLGSITCSWTVSGIGASLDRKVGARGDFTQGAVLSGTPFPSTSGPTPSTLGAGTYPLTIGGLQNLVPFVGTSTIFSQTLVQPAQIGPEGYLYASDVNPMGVGLLSGGSYLDGGVAIYENSPIEIPSGTTPVVIWTGGPMTLTGHGGSHGTYVVDVSGADIENLSDVPIYCNAPSVPTNSCTTSSSCFSVALAADSIGYGNTGGPAGNGGSVSWRDVPYANGNATNNQQPPTISCVAGPLPDGGTANGYVGVTLH